MFMRIAPFVFVLLWSSGWIFAAAAAPYSDPLTFLAARYAFAAAALALLVPALGRRWPDNPRLWMHGLASGVLLHAIYLGGVWWAIDKGLPTPISGLIAAVQPLLTAVLAVSLIGERLNRLQWLGLSLGLAGLTLGLAPKFAGLSSGADLSTLVVINIAAMVSVTLGTLYQKRFLAGGDLMSVVMMQYLGAFIATAPAAFLLESLEIRWTVETIAAMAWSVIALSIGAVGLLLLMIRHGAVSRVASLIYLIPPTVALQSYLFFGETLLPIQLLGMGVTVLGVYLVNRTGATRGDAPISVGVRPFRNPGPD